MTPQASNQNAPTLFTDAQWHIFRDLRVHYLQGLHLFSKREIARLVFLRWLHTHDSFGEAGFECLGPAIQETDTLKDAPVPPTEHVVRYRQQRGARRSRTTGAVQQPHEDQQPGMDDGAHSGERQ